MNFVHSSAMTDEGETFWSSMSLDVVAIPTHIRAQLAASSDFVFIALNSWRETAAATNELVQRNFTRMDHASAEERASPTIPGCSPSRNVSATATMRSEA